MGDAVETPPYRRAKPSFLIQDQLKDAQWLGKLMA
jgi:hypothetical protein